jgi:hypothetical protein
MLRTGISFSTILGLIVGSALLLFSVAATAQRHGGGGMGGGGGISGISHPTGLDEKDNLKDFHTALAVQATSPQMTEFQALLKSIESAQAELQPFLQPPQKQNPTAESDRRDPLDRALENVRSGNKHFQAGFSPAQKAGLKDLSRRLSKADSDLEQIQRRLDQTLQINPASPEVVLHAESLHKALTDFYNQQLALGREMSITLATGQDTAFILPPVKDPIRIDNQTIPVAVSGVLSQISAQGGRRTFKLEMTADLSDLQQNMIEILRSKLDTSPLCGQRVAVRQATLTPATPASVLLVWLHFERWMCTRSFGQQTANELAEGDGTVEIKLSAAVEKPNTLKVLSTFGRIDATGLLGESLRSGSLGEDLRDYSAQLVLSAARAGSDFKITLPPALQNSALIQSAKFQDLGVGGLSLVLEGQIEISNEQADQLASQLNQTLSAQQAPAQ